MSTSVRPSPLTARMLMTACDRAGSLIIASTVLCACSAIGWVCAEARPQQKIADMKIMKRFMLY